MTPHLLAPPDEAAPLWRAALPGRPLGGLTVLAVEDSRFASEAVRLLCLRSGARIRRADCLRTAARHLQVYRPAAVIVDMGLPDGDGAGLIARLAGQALRVPVILGMSGDPGAEAAARAAGRTAFWASRSKAWRISSRRSCLPCRRGCRLRGCGFLIAAPFGGAGRRCGAILPISRGCWRRDRTAAPSTMSRALRPAWPAPPATRRWNRRRRWRKIMRRAGAGRPSGEAGGLVQERLAGAV